MSTSLTEVFDSTLTAVFRSVPRKAPQEQEFRKHPALEFLESAEASPTVINGSYKIQVPVSAVQSTRAVNVRKGTTIPLTDADDTEMSELTMTHKSTPIMLWGTDLHEASGGETKLYDLTQRKRSAAEMEMKDSMDTDFWASSAAVNGVSGIRLAFPTDGGNSSTAFQGLAGNTKTYWRSQAITTGGVASTAMVNQLDQMDQNIRTEGRGPWDVIFTTYNLERIYKQVFRTYMSANVNVTGTRAGKRAADLGLSFAHYDGRPIIPDQSCPAGFMYFVTLDAYKIGYDPDANYSIDPFVSMLPGEMYGKASLMHCRWTPICFERRRNGQNSGYTES